MVQGYVFCLLQPAEITRKGPTCTPPRKPKPSRSGRDSSSPAATDPVDDAIVSREERISKLGDVESLDLESDEEYDETASSPPSLSPRSLRALQQRVAGTRGVDPNIVGSSGGIW